MKLLAWRLAVTAVALAAMAMASLTLASSPRTVVRTVTVTRTLPAKVITRTMWRTHTVYVTASPAAQPATPPFPHINGATHSVLVNCSVEQCTSLPGAGPNGGTCGAIVDNEQECVW